MSRRISTFWAVGSGSSGLRQVPVGVEVMVMPSGGLWLTLPPGTIPEPVASWVRETATVAVVHNHQAGLATTIDVTAATKDFGRGVALVRALGDAAGPYGGAWTVNWNPSNWELLVPPGSSRVQRE